jgi:SHS2 domain-containing protein
VSGAPAGWEHFAHAANVGVRGFGAMREAAFEQRAVALMPAIGDADRIEPRAAVEIACAAPDDTLLFVDRLNALTFEVATRRMLFCRFEVRSEGRHLAGRAWGEPIDPTRHEVAIEVKGATYTDLKVGPRPGGGWLAQCVVDV